MWCVYAVERHVVYLTAISFCHLPVCVCCRKAHCVLNCHFILPFIQRLTDCRWTEMLKYESVLVCGEWPAWLTVPLLFTLCQALPSWWWTRPGGPPGRRPSCSCPSWRRTTPTASYSSTTAPAARASCPASSTSTSRRTTARWASPCGTPPNWLHTSGTRWSWQSVPSGPTSIRWEFQWSCGTV